ncbi:MAG: ParB/RepB/Spo0J family partition protein [Bradyrhizobium sp.]|nr:ParB/RepB/Spo0J family partition protein [Bradyrhizobium sp.]
MTIEMLPLNLLTPSQANVRKTNAGLAIEDLAASIQAHGLLQNLQVRRTAKGKYEVVAGGRRLAAMTVLRRQKKLAKDFPVPCHIIDEADAGEISLAENIVRLAMHPADQFIAFHALAEQGMGLEDIAARFGVSPVIVRQRLKLASVSPLLIGVYRESDMTLDQLMAFTVSDDHAAQESAWYDQPDYNRRPHTIRATLTEAQVECGDRRVRFVGLDAYLAEGGGLNRDLFQPEHEGYLTDPALLDRLVNAKLSATAEDLRGEGWAWVDIMPVRSLAGFGRVRPTRQPLDAAQSARLEALSAEYDALAATHGEDAEPEIAERLETLWAEIEAIEETAYQWSEEDKARAGAVVSIDYDGGLLIERGYVRPEDVRGQLATASAARDGGADAPKPTGLSATLVESLTAERTAAMRALLMDNQPVALASLCHALALPLFYPMGSNDHACLHISLQSRDLSSRADGIDSSRAGTALAERYAAWEMKLPEDAASLFGWLLAAGTATCVDLLAFCAAQSIDAVRGKADRPDTPRLAHADALADAVTLDMRDWWVPTIDSYTGRVSRALMLDAVREGVSPQAAENLANLKKEKLAQSAAQRLAGTGWLPVILRSSVTAEAEMDNEVRAAA